jgi:hypothetical protein
MKKSHLLSATLLALATLAPLSAHADIPGAHPGYLHALSDLRAARWMIEHRPAGYRAAEHEGAAIAQIDAAIHAIRDAAIDDGKNLADHPPVDERPDRQGRLHGAMDFLHRAHDDIAHEETNGYARGPQHNAVAHIDAAMQQVDRAIGDAQRGL